MIVPCETTRKFTVRRAALERAQRLGGGVGNYALQAAIAACQSRRDQRR
jgi:predicted RNA polymerase sigma factor